MTSLIRAGAMFILFTVLPIWAMADAQIDNFEAVSKFIALKRYCVLETTLLNFSLTCKGEQITIQKPKAVTVDQFSTIIGDFMLNNDFKAISVQRESGDLMTGPYLFITFVRQ